MSALSIALIIVSILLIGAVLLQQRSTGLGGAFGGDSAVYTSRRGAEKSLYRLTILLGITLCALVLWSAWQQRPVETTTATTAAETVEAETTAEQSETAPATTTESATTQ